MPITIRDKTYEKGVTHPGTFHVDDVFATALLRIIDPDFPVERRDATDDDGPEVLVYDESRPSERHQGEFDHHGPNKRHRKHGGQTEYSSFGLLWQELGETLCHREDARLIDRDIVEGIDLTDNRGKSHPFAMAIADIQQTGDDVDESFWKAVEFAKGILERRMAALAKTRESTARVMAIAEKQDWPETLVLDEWLEGWPRVGTRNECMLFCVFPSMRGGWSAQGVRKRRNDGEVRCPFPKEWCDAEDDELPRLTGVPDATFCHTSGFIACARTREGAMALAARAAEGTHDETTWLVTKTTDDGDTTLVRKTPSHKTACVMQDVAAHNMRRDGQTGTVTVTKSRDGEKTTESVMKVTD